MPVTKSKRFEVFARDGFTCQYCGKRPPDAVLELDHIHPKAKGGTDDDLNLITSCFDCNRGKAAKVIRDVAPRPDADLKYLKVLQEEAEVKRYLAASCRLEKVRSRALGRLLDIWNESIPEDAPDDRIWKSWMSRFGPEEIENAIRIVAPRAVSGYLCGDDLSRYITGIMKRVREQQETASV